MTDSISPSPQPQRRRALFAAGAVVLIGVVAFVLLRGRGSAPEAKPVASMTVTSTAAETLTWPGTLDASGAIAPWQEAIVGARVSGLPLAEVRVDVGDKVRRGDLLARFDDATVRARLTQAQAALVQARANSRLADANRERAEQLRSTGALSEQSILQNETQAEAARAQVTQLEGALAAARLELQYTRITAPDDGVISVRSATLGAVAQPGSELFRLIRRGRLEWRGELSPAQLTDVKPGLAVKLALPDGTEATARVRQVAPALDSNSRLAIVYADVDAGSAARAGMYVRGRIETATSAALTVPAESVVIHDGRTYVARLDRERVRLTQVVTGRHEGDRIEIVEGLTSGQPVVVRGAGFLADNDLVRVVSPDETPSAARVAEQTK